MKWNHYFVTVTPRDPRLSESPRPASLVLSRFSRLEVRVARAALGTIFSEGTGKSLLRMSAAERAEIILLFPWLEGAFPSVEVEALSEWELVPQ